MDVGEGRQIGNEEQVVEELNICGLLMLMELGQLLHWFRALRVFFVVLFVGWGILTECILHLTMKRAQGVWSAVVCFASEGIANQMELDWLVMW
jgi:hypothetical protein